MVYQEMVLSSGILTSMSSITEITASENLIFLDTINTLT